MKMLETFTNIGQRPSSKHTPSHSQSTRHHQYLTDFYNVIQDTYSRDRAHGPATASLESKQACEACGHNTTCANILEPNKATVRWGIHPIILLLKFVGILHARSRGRRLFTPSFVYAFLVFIMTWVNFFRFCFQAYSEVTDFGTKLFLRITVHVWFGQVALTCTLYLFHISAGLRSLMHSWDKYIQKYDCRTGQAIRKASKKSIVITMTLTGAILVLALVCFIQEKSPQVIGRFYIPFFSDLPPLYVRIIYVIFLTYLILLWLIPTAFLFAICMGIRYNFKTLLQDFIKKEKDLDEFALERFRRKHHQLCRLVKQTDGLFSLFNLFTYMTSIPLLCFVIYNFAFGAHEKHELGLALSMGHLVLIVFQMGIVTAAASSVCMAAVAPAEHLFELDIEQGKESRETVHRAIQVMLFLQRVTSGHIGLTAWNVFNINKQTILTVSTLCVSYVFILAKFGIALELVPKTHLPSVGLQASITANTSGEL